MIDPALLSAYIASRICHDLVSPVSSVASAIDFLNEPTDSEMRQQAEQLLQKGSGDAGARLQFLRYAFGSMGLSDGAADIHEAKSVTENFVATHKPTVNWDIETDHLSYSHARLMMNLLMIGVDCLPRGGTLGVRIRNDADGLSIIVDAVGNRAKLRDETALAVEGQQPEGGWSARNIQPLFTRMIADGLGAAITVQAGEDRVVISARGVRAEG